MQTKPNFQTVNTSKAQIFGFLFFSRIILKLVEIFGRVIDLRYGYYEHGIMFWNLGLINRKYL